MKKSIELLCSFIPDYFAYVEAGFDGRWKHYSSLEEALEEVCYDELYVAYKVKEENVKKLLKDHNDKKSCLASRKEKHGKKIEK